MLRSFIAIQIPTEIQDLLASSISPLVKSLPRSLVRWVPTHNVHLTLKFLGDVSPEGLDQLSEALRLEIERLDPFTLGINKVGAFPTPQRARVIWLGIESPPALQNLAVCIETVARKNGFTQEDRPFSPHLTMGRVNERLSSQDLGSISTALARSSVGRLGTFTVNAIYIFKSDLQPGGPIYTALHRLAFRSTEIT